LPPRQSLFDFPHQPLALLPVQTAGEALVLAEDGARPVIFYPRHATCQHPQVKGMTMMVNNIYNGFRFEDLWLDR
jgi:hypothetical protein